jgi:hypothetical protein
VRRLGYDCFAAPDFLKLLDSSSHPSGGGYILVDASGKPGRRAALRPEPERISDRKRNNHAYSDRNIAIDLRKGTFLSNFDKMKNDLTSSHMGR